jgi:hypothetical protein
LGDDLEFARELFRVLPQVPMPVWGRDELETGEMWNSNSVIACLLTECGTFLDGIRLPEGGRALGFDAGVCVAIRGRSARPSFKRGVDTAAETD